MDAPFPIPRNTRLKTRVGRCYELSGQAAMEHADWWLVHGVVNKVDGTRIGHAWIERTGWVYDAVLDRAMPAEAFRAQFGATEWSRWSGGEAVALEMLRQGHWGPWIETDAAR